MRGDGTLLALDCLADVGPKPRPDAIKARLPKGCVEQRVETVDYAPKHWSGLIKDYYAARVGVVAAEALAAAAAGAPLTPTDVDRAKAELAYNWTTAENAYPSEPSGDAVAVSRTMYDRYARYFGTC